MFEFLTEERYVPTTDELVAKLQKGYRIMSMVRNGHPSVMLIGPDDESMTVAKEILDKLIANGTLVKQKSHPTGADPQMVSYALAESVAPRRSLVESIDLVTERSKVDDQIKKAGKLSQVDPKLAKVIVRSGLKDGSKPDDRISVTKKSWSPGKLKPSQTSMVLAKSIGMALLMIEENNKNADLGAIVSKDNYIMDGHHRWSANVLAWGKSGKVGGYQADVPGKRLLKVLNLLTKGLFNKTKGNKGSGRLADYKPAKVKKMLTDLSKNGIKGDYPKSPEYVQEMLTKRWGSVEKGIEEMSKNAKLITTSVPSWAPDRSDMPVIDPDEIPKAKKELERGKVDHEEPLHTEGINESKRGPLGLDVDKLKKEKPQTKMSVVELKKTLWNSMSDPKSDKVLAAELLRNGVSAHSVDSILTQRRRNKPFPKRLAHKD